MYWGYWVRREADRTCLTLVKPPMLRAGTVKLIYASWQYGKLMIGRTTFL